MRLSKTAYFADFAAYAAVLGVLISVAALDERSAEHVNWLRAFMAGAIAWTLLEYLMHRLVLHRLRPFLAMHGAHHDSPRAYLGTPTWMSLGFIWLVIFLPAWWGFSLNVASGLTAGVMSGFLWYGILHHAIHHREPRLLASWVSAAARRHMRHHYSAQLGNFGVTTPFWDHLFRTVVRERPFGRTTRRQDPQGNAIP
jgi:sterol desaturase/sphingolipid hydroxylase (fatty acid hydroxylase superfamily)